MCDHFIIFVIFLRFMCICALSAFMYMYYVCVPGVHRGQKRMSDPRELEL